ncbi:D-inositol-3-phosphate glycosyltransferase [Sediminivirga luteola]|uniref:D-inositol 3-phosphate glycosyltransferase n=2 Tax=Sediminivirga luteola TaxID=1774748 RepID=A0A8J2TXT2_9MICO|nr:glycosyltransferase [Sediminivirga luteola]GGA13950.1 D-inositol 3-phosphate glycosyltransferase [Sediminivirga luteola]
MLSLHTNPLQQPGQGDAGGLNVYVLNLGRELARIGCQVDIFTADPSTAGSGTVRAPFGEPGLCVHQIDLPDGEALDKGRLAERIPELAARIGAHPACAAADILHAHYWISAAVARRIAAPRDVPVVSTMHTLGAVKNEAVGYQLEPQARIDAERRIAAGVDLLIANAGRDRQDHLRHLGAPARRVQVIRPGVDTSVFRPRAQAAARERLGLSGRDLIALYVGRLQHVKGPDIAIGALAGLARLNPALAERTSLTVVGESSGERSALSRARELAGRLGVGQRVDFVPPAPAEELAQWYAAADVLLVPSRSESFGLVALEAAASGLPVLASAVGGLSEAVTASAGVLMHSGDTGVWARELELLLLDPDRRSEMGVRAAREAAGQTWRRAAEQTVAAYRRVLAGERLSVPDDEALLCGTAQGAAGGSAATAQARSRERSWAS